MLVNRKIQNDVYEQHETLPVKRVLPQLDVALRAKCLMLVVVLAIGAMCLTMRSEAIIRAGYDLVQMKSQALRLQGENEMLQLEIAKLKSPQRIQSIATMELGMEIPQGIYCAESIPANKQPTVEKEKNLVSQVVNTFKGQ